MQVHSSSVLQGLKCILYSSNMYNFTNKYICLVLTCNKPQYKERLNLNSHIYNQIADAGFEIIFLYADPTITYIHIIQNEDASYNMTVPTKEEYTNLATKMNIAYFYFNTLNIKGILKIDDDITYINNDSLNLDYYNQYDYLGLYGIHFDHLNLLDHKSYKKDKYKDYMLNINESDISEYPYFFPGHFYWVSKKAIQYIAASKWPCEIIGACEDAFVGLSLADKKDITCFLTNWDELGYIKFMDSLKL